MGFLKRFNEKNFRVLESFQDSNGKYSSKKLTKFAAFIACVAILVLEACLIHIPEYIFYGFLSLSGIEGVISVYDKTKNTVASAITPQITPPSTPEPDLTEKETGEDS